MKIFVKVKTGAKENQLNQLEKTEYQALVKARPIKGQANRALIKLVADYFQVSQSEIKIISGQSSKNKIMEIDAINSVLQY